MGSASATGFRVVAGNDDIRDAWWPDGDADMLGRAIMIGDPSPYVPDAGLASASDMAITDAAAVPDRER